MGEKKSKPNGKENKTARLPTTLLVFNPNSRPLYPRIAMHVLWKRKVFQVLSIIPPRYFFSLHLRHRQPLTPLQGIWHLLSSYVWIILTALSSSCPPRRQLSPCLEYLSALVGESFGVLLFPSSFSLQYLTTVSTTNTLILSGGATFSLGGSFEPLSMKNYIIFIWLK